MFDKFEAWFVKRWMQKQVRQGFNHRSNIVNIYGMLADAFKKEFTEDNAPTQGYYLIEQHQQALREHRILPKQFK